MARKRIDDTIKKGVIEAQKKGLTRKKIAEKFGISPTSVSRITKSSIPSDNKPRKKADKKSERMKRIEALERRLLELEKKIDRITLKK